MSFDVEKVQARSWNHLAMFCLDLDKSMFSEERSPSESVIKFIQDLYDESGRGEYPNKPHPCRKEVIAWANGADVEITFKGISGWHPAAKASDDKIEYRLKPKKSAKDIEIENIQSYVDKLNKRLEQLKGE